VIGSWELAVDGDVVQHGTLPRLAVPPKTVQELTVPFKVPALEPGAECFLKLTFSLSDDTLWAKRGHVLAWDQLEVPVEAPPTPKADVAAMPPVDLKESPDAITVAGAGFSLTVGKASGAIELFECAGEQLISNPLVPNLWRAPIDNDEGNEMPEQLGIWRSAGPDRKVNTVKAEQVASQVVRITAETTLPAGDSPYRTVYTVYGSGDVVVENSFEPGKELPELPRFGMQMTMPGEFSTVQWYGRGPHESYWDRKTSAAVGAYSLSVEDLIYHYIKPQENANRTDVRWVAFTNREGIGLLAVGMPLLNFSAWPYAMQDLENATHNYQLPRRGTVTVNLDYKQRGLGGDDSWGALPHPEYTLPAKPYSYRFRLTPLADKKKSISALAGRTF